MFKKSVDKRLHGAQSTMLPYAQSIAKDKGLVLDYSNGSIPIIDELVVKLVQELRDEGINGVDSDEPSEAALGYIEVFGCYIVETIEKNNGKVIWSDRDPVSGEFAYSVKLQNGTVIFPMDWVVKKMQNPDSYQISERYKEYVLGKD